MQVQDVKRWHWTAMALAIGLGLSYVWSSIEPGEGLWGKSLPSLAPLEFERGLTIQSGKHGHVDDIRVMPPQEGKYRVICTQLRRGRQPGQEKAIPMRVITEAPYKSQMTGQTCANIVEYLKSVKRANPAVSFTYAWYRETWVVFVLWTGASLLLIGGVWPSVVSLLTGGGWGLVPRRREPKYDLERFGEGQAEAPKSAAPPMATRAEMDELAKLEAELEQKLAGGAGAGDGGAATATAATADPAPIRKLSGGPVEEVKVQQEEVEKEYGGEFYPVVRSIHTKKKEEEEEK